MTHNQYLSKKEQLVKEFRLAVQNLDKNSREYLRLENDLTLSLIDLDNSFKGIDY